MTATVEKSRKVRIMVIMAIIMFVQGFSMFKLVPMQSAISSYFNIDSGAYSFLTTSQNIFVIAFTIPFGFVTRKITPKWSILIGYVMMMLGGLLEIVTTNYVLFVVGRTIEGGGFGFVTLVIYSAVANIVGPKKAGLWVSIYISLNMVAQIINTRGSTWLMVSKGISFKTIFTGILIAQAIACVLWLFIMPGDFNIIGNTEVIKASKEETMRVYKEPGNWLVAISMGFYLLISTVFSAYAIKYLVVKGLEQSNAANMYSYTTLFSIAAMLISGWLSGKLHTKRKIAIFSYFGCVVTMVCLVLLPKELIFIYIVLFGFVPRAITGMGQAAASDLAESPAQVPIINSLRNTVSQVIALVGGIAMGYAIQYWGYATTIYILAALQAVGGICWIFTKKVP